MLFVLSPLFAPAQQFTSNFSDGNFCEFDLQRLPVDHPNTDCGPFAFISYARMKNALERQFVYISMNPQVPFNEKYRYKMELSVPMVAAYSDHQKITHAFSLIVPSLPKREKIFPQIAENATAFVIAQWHATNGKSPPMAIRITNRKEFLITIDRDILGSEETERVTLWRGAIPENRILNFSFEAFWHLTNGILRVQLNDQDIVEYRGPLGQKMETSRYYFKYGLYHSYKDQLADDFQFSILLGELRQENLQTIF